MKIICILISHNIDSSGQYVCALLRTMTRTEVGCN